MIIRPYEGCESGQPIVLVIITGIGVAFVGDDLSGIVNVAVSFQFGADGGRKVAR